MRFYSVAMKYNCIFLLALAASISAMAVPPPDVAPPLRIQQRVIPADRLLRQVPLARPRPVAPPRPTLPINSSGKSKGENVQLLDGDIFHGGFFDETKWEVVDQIGNIYNRLVLWHGKAVHSASVYFGKDIEDSRLFQVFFFNARPK